MFEDKFTKIFESNFNRFQGGGLLAGDVVKFIDNAINDKWFDGQTSTIKDKVQEILNTDLNLRVASVKALRPAADGGAQQDQQTDNFYCDVALERAPGLYTDIMTIPVHLIQVVDLEGNLAPIPDSLRADDQSHIEPREVDLKPGEDEHCAVWGTKTHEGDKKLPTKDSGMVAESTEKFDTSVYISS